MKDIKTVLRMALESESIQRNQVFISELEGEDYEMYQDFGINYGIEAEWFFDKLMDNHINLPEVLEQIVAERRQ